MEMVERQDLDMVILFYNPVMMDPAEPDIMSIVKRCDQYNIPVATNIATAELLQETLRSHKPDILIINPSLPGYSTIQLRKAETVCTGMK